MIKKKTIHIFCVAKNSPGTRARTRGVFSRAVPADESQTQSTGLQYQGTRNNEVSVRKSGAELVSLANVHRAESARQTRSRRIQHFRLSCGARGNKESRSGRIRQHELRCYKTTKPGVYSERETRDNFCDEIRQSGADVLPAVRHTKTRAYVFLRCQAQRVRRDTVDAARVAKFLKPEKMYTIALYPPGPAYELKTLVGYKNHCISRYRNPAYTFGRRGADIFGAAEGPGPKYMIREQKRVGFTFGIPAKRRDLHIEPGPKYKLPDVSHGPFFSVKWRTKLRKRDETPGPYYVKPIADAPAFYIGLHTAGLKPPDTPGPYTYEVNAIKPRAPMYTMTARRMLRVIPTSPGPVYALPPIKPTPAYSFGVKHSVCAPPYIVECDDQC